MHARVAVYQMKPGTANDVLDLARRDLVGELSKRRGFVSYDLVRGGEDDIVSYSLWESAEDAAQASDFLRRWVDRNIGDSVVRTFTHVGEVVATTREPVPG